MDLLYGIGALISVAYVGVLAYYIWDALNEVMYVEIENEEVA
jgi:hypothetical protein